VVLAGPVVVLTGPVVVLAGPAIDTKTNLKAFSSRTKDNKSPT
jgi:hypothetical protein